MHITLAALADAANTTDNGKLNMLGVFNTLSASAVPVRHPQMYLVLRFQISPGEKGHDHKLRFVLADADGSIVNQSPEFEMFIPVEAPGTNTEFNIILSLPNLVLPKFGQYIFDILINNNSVYQVPLEVRPISPKDDADPDAPFAQ